MAIKESLPFQRGQTFYGATPSDTTAHKDLEGREYVIIDDDQSGGNSGGVGGNRTGREVRLRIVRNLSGGALLPKRIAKMKTDGSAYEYSGQVSGYADTVGQKGFPIDEYLPAAGVSSYDLFYVVVKGPAMCTTGASGDTNIATGNFVIPTTDGKVIDQDLTAADGQDTTFASLFNQMQGAIGRAILGVNATSANILIDVGG